MRAVFKNVLRILAIIFCLLNSLALKDAGAQCNPNDPMASGIEELKAKARTAIREKAEELGIEESVNMDNIHFAYSGECTQAKDFTFLANAAVNEPSSTRANRDSKNKIAGIVYFDSLECVDMNGAFQVEIKMKDGIPVSADLISKKFKIRGLDVEWEKTDPNAPNIPGSLVAFETFNKVTKNTRVITSPTSICSWCGSITLTYTNFSGYIIRIPVRY